MVEYHLGLTPGIIVGLILVLLVLTAMLVSTVVVVWRSRPAALARAHQRQIETQRKAADLESGLADKPRASSELPVSILKKTKSDGEDTDPDTDDSIDGSPDLQTPQVNHGSSVNVIIATDGAGGVEVRVTPPTPSQSMAALKGDRRVRFESLAGAQGENESVWWFI
ncbi:hypothetical protein TRAPUB_11067 [Trametes pubescens]|uniref:Uncharacterized protein n=1 Tax=Trametes pubescens TaxID=154538 RepID=A0A1M2VXP6_TRAPU|nr:hypothetical protein TRAPUB_11067 [Trametes pubescens]